MEGDGCRETMCCLRWLFNLSRDGVERAGGSASMFPTAAARASIVALTTYSAAAAREDTQTRCQSEQHCRKNRDGACSGEKAVRRSRMCIAGERDDDDGHEDDDGNGGCGG